MRQCNMTEAEQQAVEVHRYTLSLKAACDVSIEEAREDWFNHHAEQWRVERIKHMNHLQREAIAEYKWLKSEKAQCDVGHQAALEWVHKYAASFREWYEEEHSGADLMHTLLAQQSKQTEAVPAE